MEQLLNLWNPDNVLSLLLFLIVIGTGIFISRNWKVIFEFFQKNAERKHELEIRKLESDQHRKEKLDALIGSMHTHNQATASMEARVGVLIEYMERLIRHLGNGDVS